MLSLVPTLLLCISAGAVPVAGQTVSTFDVNGLANALRSAGFTQAAKVTSMLNSSITGQQLLANLANGNYTLFVPIDEAFHNVSSYMTASNETIAEYASYHFVSGDLRNTTAESGGGGGSGGSTATTTPSSTSQSESSASAAPSSTSESVSASESPSSTSQSESTSSAESTSSSESPSSASAASTSTSVVSESAVSTSTSTSVSTESASSTSESASSEPASSSGSVSTETSTATQASTETATATQTTSAFRLFNVFRRPVYQASNTTSPKLQSLIYPQVSLGLTLLYPAVGSNLVRLPCHQPQKLAWTRSGVNGNVTFLNQRQNITVVNSTQFQNISIYGITGILIPPGNVSTALKAINATGYQNFIAPITRPNWNGSYSSAESIIQSLQGVTVFVPNNAAFQNAQGQLQNIQSNDTAVASLLTSHIAGLDAEPLYTDPQISVLASVNQSIPNLNSRNISFVQNGTGSYVLGQNNTSAKIVRPDVLMNNGVIHVIDRVLINTNFSGTSSIGSGPSPSVSTVVIVSSGTATITSTALPSQESTATVTSTSTSVSSAIVTTTITITPSEAPSSSPEPGSSTTASSSANSANSEASSASSAESSASSALSSASSAESSATSSAQTMLGRLYIPAPTPTRV